METQNAERERLALPIGQGLTSESFNEAEELGLPEYARFISDTKNALIQYAEKNNRKEILERAKELGAEDRDLKSDLNMLLVLLKAEHDSV